MVPHQNWRGEFARGTFGVNPARAMGTRSDCAGNVTVPCVDIPWPGEATTPRHQLATTPHIQN